MEYAQLRSLLAPLIMALKDAGTHSMLPTMPTGESELL